MITQFCKDCEHSEHYQEVRFLGITFLKGLEHLSKCLEFPLSINPLDGEMDYRYAEDVRLQDYPDQDCPKFELR